MSTDTEAWNFGYTIDMLYHGQWHDAMGVKQAERWIEWINEIGREAPHVVIRIPTEKWSAWLLFHVSSGMDEYANDYLCVTTDCFAIPQRSWRRPRSWFMNRHALPKEFEGYPVFDFEWT